MRFRISFLTLFFAISYGQEWTVEPSRNESCKTGTNKTISWEYDPAGQTLMGITWQLDGTDILSKPSGGDDFPASGYGDKVESALTIHNAAIKLMNCQPSDFGNKVLSVRVTLSSTFNSVTNPTLAIDDFTYSYSTNNGESGTLQPGTDITKADVPLTITITSSTSPTVTMYVVATSDVTQTPLLPVNCTSPSSGCSLTIDDSFISKALQLVVDTDASDDPADRFIKSAAFTATEPTTTIDSETSEGTSPSTPSTPDTTQSSTPKPDKKLGTGAIAGIVVGCVAAVVIIIIIIVCYRKKSKEKHPPRCITQQPPNDTSTMPQYGRARGVPPEQVNPYAFPDPCCRLPQPNATTIPVVYDAKDKSQNINVNPQRMGYDNPTYNGRMEHPPDYDERLHYVTGPQHVSSVHVR